MKLSMKHYALLAILFFISACASAPTRMPTAAANVHVLPTPFPMPGLNRERTVRVYLPPSYGDQSKRFPVLYMHDGQNLFDDATSYVGEWGVDETLNELAKSHGIEIIVVGIDHGREKRRNELVIWPHPIVGAAEGEHYLRFLVHVLKPHIDKTYRTKSTRDDTAIMGSSLGGLMSHYAIHQHPNLFSKAGIFSPAYWVNPEIFAHMEKTPLPADAKLFLLVGGKEGPEYVEQTLRAAALEEKIGLRKENIVAKNIATGEHNEKFWRAYFGEAVLWMFAKW